MCFGANNAVRTHNVVMWRRRNDDVASWNLRLCLSLLPTIRWKFGGTNWSATRNSSWMHRDASSASLNAMSTRNLAREASRLLNFIIITYFQYSNHPITPANLTMAKRNLAKEGRQDLQTKCSQCHNVEGEVDTVPTFTILWSPVRTERVLVLRRQQKSGITWATILSLNTKSQKYSKVRFRRSCV
jgi:cytochrome c553